ncbi:hypothetical protein GOV14_01710 [Candidatus Pacearchaeota archaeon]|nr:hypothetical protein [Candidatus Pacearchaeota archaeon]
MNLIEELGKNYNFPEKQIRILKSLEFRDLTARELSKQTQIPLGRLYEHINNLLRSKLIEKSKKKPAFYSFKNKEEKIKTFIKDQFKETVDKEALMLSLLEKGSGDVKLLTTREDYILECRRIYNEEDKIFSIERASTPPYYFYPEDYADYKKVRKFVKKKRELVLGNDSLEKLYKENYFDNLNKQKKFIGITNKKSLTEFLNTMKKALGPDKFKKQIKKIIRLVNSKTIHCKVVKSEFPYYLLITDNVVLICFVSNGKAINLLIRDKEITKKFKVFFESMYRDAEYVSSFLKKFL